MTEARPNGTAKGDRHHAASFMYAAAVLYWDQRACKLRRWAWRGATSEIA